ncbi:GNAT family N-acetyltransferase [Acetobacter pomorum]|uniref:GNAT family N-acetyltransferase n=1 Tax=Acetobacter pomorum TaxID=65959 RepID=A0A2G4RAF2_9PROT|nr:GNAT family N-acetyltransferase [Acetobacter pomorum]PHY93490.1 GNAT family N-acetyltransferase [Acetobacter pomorum]GBR49050.1 acetyltransferase [Acetobacter pomorum DSM 11825]
MITDLNFNAESTTRMKVIVTFMRMVSPPQHTPLALPEGWCVQEHIRPDVAGYRLLQDRVGREYCWWMRQAASDNSLAHFLQTAPVNIGLLRHGQQIQGFFELDLADPQSVNLSYFGLFPEAVGHGVGRAFLDHVLRLAWRNGPQSVRVNTCNADHPRALPLYQQAGFKIIRRVEEVWDVPDRLGIPVPQHLRV